MTNLDSTLKSIDITLPTKVCLVEAMVFPVILYECDSSTVKQAECRRTDAFELWCWRSLDSPLDCREIQPVHPKGNQSSIFTERADSEAETPKLWPPGKKNWLIGKDPDAGKDRRQGEEGTTEDEMAGWHQWLDGHEFEWTLGVGDGQGGLACCSPWGSQRVRHDWATELTLFQSSVMKSFSILPRRQSYLCNHIQCIVPSLSSCLLVFRSKLLQYHSFVSSKPYFNNAPKVEE